MWDAVTGLLQDPDRLREELRRRREEGSPTRESAERELGIATVRLKRIPMEQDRLVAGYDKGLIPDDKMREWMESLQTEERELTDRVQELERRLSRLELTEEQENNAVRFAECTGWGLNNLKFGERRELVQLLVEDIRWVDSTAEVHTIIPLEGETEGSLLCSPIRGRPGGSNDFRGWDATLCRGFKAKIISWRRRCEAHWKDVLYCSTPEKSRPRAVMTKHDSTSAKRT